MPVLVIIATVGILGFLAVSNTANFQSELFSSLFPKPDSSAATLDSDCKVGIKSFEVVDSCGYTTGTIKSYKSAKFECTDGYQGTVGDGSTCRYGKALKEEAENICNSRLTCFPSPTSVNYPYPVPDYTLSPTPIYGYTSPSYFTPSQ